MKNLFLLCSFLLATNLVHAQESITWLKFEEAVAANEANPKMLLVDVYTDWCGWCKKMDRDTFTHSDVISYVNERFYAVKLNAEDSKRTFDFMGKTYTEAEMAAIMRVRSYPNFVVIDPTLQNMAQMPGYRQPAAFISGIDELIDKAFRPKL